MPEVTVPRPSKRQPTTIRLRSDVVAALCHDAAIQGRSVSNLIEIILASHYDLIETDGKLDE